jgi:hypothetical protein
MVYICVINKNFTNSCKIIISKKIIYTSLLVISVTSYQAEKILNSIIKYLIDNNYNKKGGLYEDSFYYECVCIIVPYLEANNIDFTVIDTTKKWSCFCC